jgi:DUF4097 and DUF4098 domain-containing protein YvlB
MKILTMVEEGKITAQEAAKLLEAIGRPKEKGEFSSRIVEKVMDGVSGIVGGAFSMALGEEKEMGVEKGDELVIKSVGSSVQISLHERDDFVIKPSGGLVKTKKEDKIISTKIVGGAAQLLCPQTLAMTIKDAGGSVEGDGSAKLSLKQLGGACDLSFKQIDDVSIDSKGGSVTVYLGDCDVAFNVTASDGNIDFDVPADFEIQKGALVKGRIKNGKGSLNIRASSGNVRVLPIEAKEEK